MYIHTFMYTCMYNIHVCMYVLCIQYVQFNITKVHSLLNNIVYIIYTVVISVVISHISFQCLKFLDVCIYR